MDLTAREGWTDEGRHPEHGVSAKSKAYFTHESGLELAVWSGVKQGSARYAIGEDDEYAVELTDGRELLLGEAFESPEVARKTAEDAMRTFVE